MNNILSNKNGLLFLALAVSIACSLLNGCDSPLNNNKQKQITSGTVSSVDHNGPYATPDLREDPVFVCKRMYLDLMLFKDEPAFKRYGFGIGCPNTKYRMWLSVVEEMRDSKRYSAAMLPLEVLPGDLLVLAMEYAMNGGQETEYTRWARSQFDHAFQLN